MTSTRFVTKETLAALPTNAQVVLKEKRPDVFADLYEETVLAGFKTIDSEVCGVTLGGYIRNRRLTLAGSELVNTNERIIDIALKYGYGSPESFTRAFSKFPGLTPSDARKDGRNLKSFSRLSVQIIMKGGKCMNYKIIEKPSFKMLE